MSRSRARGRRGGAARRGTSTAARALLAAGAVAGGAVRSRVAAEAAGLTLLAFSLVALIAVTSYSPSDPVFQITPVANRAGAVGATLAALLFGTLGYGALALLAILFLLGGRLLLGLGLPGPGSRFWLGSLLLLASSTALPALVQGVTPSPLPPEPVGSLGAHLAQTERALLSDWGALVVNGLLLLVGALGVFGVAPGRAGSAAARAGGWAAATASRTTAALAGSSVSLARQAAGAADRGMRAALVWRERRARRARVTAQMDSEPPPFPDEPITAPEPLLRRRRRPDPDIVDHRGQALARGEPQQAAFAFSEATTSGPYTLPDLDIFRRPSSGTRSYDRESLIMNSRILEKKLRDFGVHGRVVTVHPGPVITMYEFEPASGVKVNRIVSLADDLALALRALSVRIIAPLPGKSVVGIEVPNAEREVVHLREILEADSFRTRASKLTFALGKDIFGNPVEADLSKMPHLLVAGATGTGKSVFLNSLLCSILSRTTPDELKFLLIDPKLLELSVYEGIPHLIADVVTNPKRAAAALAGIVHKMEERYRMMLALGVRNILQFNERVEAERAAGGTTFRLKQKPGEEEGEELELRPLPYIVVVIDELADLMVVSARDVEESLQRLAQMARAAGIHLVLATQGLSVDVLTGVIKANFPARISFQVSSRTDSRTILDQNGAEHLLGDGDMLFLPPGTSKLQRIHGSYVSEKEVAELAAFLRSQGAPNFDDTLLRMKEESEEREKRGDDVDDFYDRAIEIVAETKNASISYLQRRLKVGYNRAARMIEQMELDGVIGPQEGTKPREVFVRPFDVE